MKILVIACARFKGGLSGSDAIYENFLKHWPGEKSYYELHEDVDYEPFWLCYLHRIWIGIYEALLDDTRYDFVYSASDFLPDVMCALIYKIKGSKWVAGFFLQAFKENFIHYWTQKVVKFLIDKLADMVVVTNPTMYPIFPKKVKTWINGGIDIHKTGILEVDKKWDVVFCGRIHKSKGIDELMQIWHYVRKELRHARLAIIGDGDLGKEYIRKWLTSRYGRNEMNGVDLLGYMGDERFKIYKRSKIVVYPTPAKYDHFSMAPVEAMACGCPLVCFNNYTIKEMRPPSERALNNFEFAQKIINLIEGDNYRRKSLDAMQWSNAFDYRKESLRVYKQIQQELGLYEDSDHWGSWNDGHGNIELAG